MLAKAVGQSMQVLTVIPSSRASPLPQVFCVVACARCRRRTDVGASLLAKAVGQSMKMLAVIPPSRASSLPQGFVLLHVPHVHPGSSVGAGLLAKAVGQSMKMLAVIPPSRASPLPQAAPACFSQCLQPKDRSPRQLPTSSVGVSEAAVFMLATLHSLLLTSPPMSWSKNIGIG